MDGVRLNEISALSNSNPGPRSSQDHHIFLLCGHCVCINCVRTCVCACMRIRDFCALPNLDIPDSRMPEPLPYK